jgi:hypothetical protein
MIGMSFAIRSMGRGDETWDRKDATLVRTIVRHAIQPRCINTVTGLSLVWGCGWAPLGTFSALTTIDTLQIFRQQEGLLKHLLLFFENEDN